MNEEQKEKLNELVDILKDKAPKEVILGAIEEIQNMNNDQVEGLVFMCELFNKYDIDEILFEETTNQ
ncbi:hypothetical protein ACIQYS_09880 [Psychrobacillus sp. NPDC096426]|uniref:hypothetical protein n=1 Tax=Psychrobacillus sp. NPDC096426 TaxID=3364491 RepID=UPI0038003EF0